MTKKYVVDIVEQIALFRYGVIADFVHLPPGAKGLYRQISKKAEGNYVIPGSHRTRIASETIRDWLKKYRKGGFDALLPKTRSDKGKARRLPMEVADVLLDTKENNPEFTVRQVIKHTRESGSVANDIKLPTSTVYKLLARNGLMRKSKEQSVDKDHRRFAFAYAGDLFMSDVMHGPSVKTDGNRKRKTYLIAFIDDATRVIPYAAFALSENTASFMEVFKQTIIRRGIPKRLFVDNGSAFRSQHFSLVCAKLGITLIHARAYHAAAKGKIERWFRTVRLQFLPTLSENNMQSLESLNRALWTYVEMEYHRTPHRMLGETPLDRWAQIGQHVRYLEPGIDLDDLFLFESKRKVLKDRTISLNGIVYEVDASLVGETVILRYNPACQGNSIEVCHNGLHVHDAKVLDAYANCFVKRNRPSQGLEEIQKSEAPTQNFKDEQKPLKQNHTVEFSKFAHSSDETEVDNV